MRAIFKVYQKTVLINTVFFLAFVGIVGVEAKPISSIENIRNKIEELLVLKQKDKALQLIMNYLKTERSHVYRTEASELLFSTAQSFMTREAQQEYESSIIETIENEKKSFKSVESCLKIESQNLDCLIQKAKLTYRLGQSKNLSLLISEINSLLLQSTFENLFQLYVDKENTNFKDRKIIQALPGVFNDKTMLYIVFELDRSFRAKNYSRAKDILMALEKNYKDWPDIVFYKRKISIESAEALQKNTDDLLTAYTNKCKNLSRSLVRKYRYDFDLCRRS